MPTILVQFWPVFIAKGVALKKQEELASHKLDGLECLDCWEKRRSFLLPSDQFSSIAVGVGDGHRLHDVLQFFETSLKHRIVKK